jgi:Glycosyltransferase sugar-binding region containing DXD motif
MSSDEFASARLQADRLPIVQYWHEKVAPDYLEEMLTTFRERNPDRPHLVFSESTAEQLIEEHFGSREVEAFRACAVPAMQADYFRYCATFALGGVYCDADHRCIASLRPLIPTPGGGHLFLRPSGAIINGLFAFGSPRHAFLELALEIATVNIERRRFDRVYFTTGPPIFTSMYWLRRLGSFDALFERAGRIEGYMRAYCEVIENCARVSDAFEGVRVSPIAKRRAFIQSPEGPLPHKATDAHWTNCGQEIFRNSSDRSGLGNA